MYLILIITLLGILLYLTYGIHSSLSSLTASTKQLAELTENSLKTRGGLYPVHSQQEIIHMRNMVLSSKRKYEENDIFSDNTDANRWDSSAQIKMGKGWNDVKSNYEDYFDAKREWEMDWELYNAMVSGNIDAFHGRKSIEQAEKEYDDLLSSLRYLGKRRNEIEKEKKEYLARIQADFEKVKNELAKGSEKK